MVKKYIMYKIVCNDEDVNLVYIGSTISFKSRKCQHKSDCNNKGSPQHNYNVYRIIRENGGWENWSMIPIEILECENKVQAHIRENELMDKYKNIINTLRAHVSVEQQKAREKQYKFINKAKIRVQSQERYHKNIDVIKERDTKRNQIKSVCVCGGSYSVINKARHLRTKKHLNYIE
jgi:hypothetical protein